MINANELRIGNWVKAGIMIEPLQVRTIDFNIKDRHLINWASIPCSDLHPIPLTHELIISAGFRHEINDDSSYYIQNDLWFCHIGDDWYLATHTEHKSLQSFHQLQNLYFALTGTELNISLLKINPHE